MAQAQVRETAENSTSSTVLELEAAAHMTHLGPALPTILQSSISNIGSVIEVILWSVDAGDTSVLFLTHAVPPSAAF